MTPEAISVVDGKYVSMDINLSSFSIFVNAGNCGCVATPHNILVRPQDTCDLSGWDEEHSD